jgi:pimeloyl-ACP methyl ester carboxylesterase
MRFKPLLAEVIATAAVCLAGAAAAGTEASIELQTCRVADVEEPLRCASYQVPENRTQAGGRKLELDIVVIPARRPLPGAAPLFVLFGGPGESASPAIGFFAKSWERQDRDVVIYDVRGASPHGGLDCDFGGSDADLQGYLQPLFADGVKYRACREALEKRADLRQYTTPNLVEDLDDVRSAMGYSKIDIEAGSYGTRFAIAYIHKYGDHVSAALLSGLVPMSYRSPLYHAAAAQRSFDKMVERCEADAACKAAYPDLHGDLAAILDQLRHAPAKVTVTNPATGKPGEVDLGPAALGDAIRVMLYTTETQAQLPLLLHRAKAGDFRPFAETTLVSSRAFKEAIRAGLLLSVACPEDVARIRPEEIEPATRGSLIGDARVRGEFAACSQWPSTSMPAGYYDPFHSPVPTLLVSGEYDPVTPPQWGEAAQKDFINSVHLVLAAGHVASNGCVAELGAKLFREASVAGLDTSCAHAVKPPPFVLPGEAKAADGGKG